MLGVWGFMTSVANKTSTKRRLLLASDRSDQSSELASILRSVGQVDTIATSDIPDAPERDLAGIVVDINLRSAESVQLVRNKLRAEAYREMPRLFVLADALHHGSMQAWALGATDTIARPFDAQGILQRIRAAFPDSDGFDETDRGKVLNRGVEAAHTAIVSLSPALRSPTRSISACARTTSAVSPVPRCCTTSARRSFRWRSWTSRAR